MPGMVRGVSSPERKLAARKKPPERLNARTAGRKRELEAQIAELQARLDELEKVREERDYYRDLYEKAEEEKLQLQQKMEKDIQAFKADARREKNRLLDERNAALKQGTSSRRALCGLRGVLVRLALFLKSYS